MSRFVSVDVFNENETGQVEIYSTYFYYDESDRRTAVKDAEGHVTFTEYDQLDRITKIIYPDGSRDELNSADNLLFTKVEYDPVLNKRTITDAKGNIIQRMYNTRGWIVAESIVNGLLSNEDDISSETGDNGEDEVVKLFNDEVYEHHEKPYFQINPEYTQIIKYDKLSRVIEESRKVTLDNVKIDFVTNYNYDRVGNKVEIINPEGQRLKLKYTPQYWLYQEITYDDTGKEYITTHSYDNVGNKKSVTDPANVVIRYEYDELYRVAEIINPDNSDQKFY
ncbi:MAG: RHS repeat protein, partial [Halanaerobiales bacterium]|nr:RHS repeat protein [Halanaerobiales bacterium]